MDYGGNDLNADYHFVYDVNFIYAFRMAYVCHV